MMTISIAAALALFLGGLGGFWFGQRRRSDAGQALREAEIAHLKPLAEQVPALRERLAADAARLEAAQQQLGELATHRARAAQADADVAALKAQIEAERANFAERTAALTALRSEMEEKFQLLAGKALQTNAEEFLRSATQLFENQKNLTNAEIEKRSKDIGDLVKPLGDSLKAYETHLSEIEKARRENYGGLAETLRAVQEQQEGVRSVTANLVGALRAAPKTRGRWGEETLKRVAEMSGLIEHCDFETEKHFRAEDASLRPDMVIQVAGGRSIIVDAKAPVSAYLDAIGAATEDERDAQLQRHAVQLRERLRDLSSKSYSDRFQGSIDCVVMFVPGDNFVSAAFERDPHLFEDGVKARVLICTPTTFIALTKAISYGWQQDRLARNALDVGRLGKELYGRLAKFGDHVTDLGKHINNAAKKYNMLVGSLENSVMPQARRFNELGVEGTSQPLAELAEVDTVVKFPQGGRDLLLSGGET
jgi:DNA recombination protein RmuC